MEQITILGAGIAGLSLVEAIKKKQNNYDITLIDQRCYHFRNSELVSSPERLNNKLELKDWSVNRNVEFINARVEKINLRRQKIYFKADIDPRSFGKLAVASGLTSKKLPLKGEHREGFFYLSALDPCKLNDQLRIAKEVTVYVSTWLGLKLCLALASLGKEVRLVSSDLEFLGQNREKVITLLKERANIFLHLDAVIEEAVGEASIKAVKISPLKVFSSQLVFIDSGFTPNLQFFEEEVCCRETFFTDFEGIYFLGDVNNPGISSEVLFAANAERAKQQAEVFAAYLLEDRPPVQDTVGLTPDREQEVINNFLEKAEVLKGG